MDWLQLLASIIDSVAWPVTIVVTAYLLRYPLFELLPNLLLFKYKELEIRFGRGLERLEQGLEQAPPPEQTSARSDSQILADESFDILAEISPSAAVLEAWTSIERTLGTVATQHNIEIRRGGSVLYITRVLKSRGIISPRLANLLDELRDLRNVAAHPTGERQISLIEARRYKEIVDQVGDELQSLLD